MNLLVAGGTDIGRKRKVNQDAIYMDRTKQLFLVADGMGGHAAGDLASEMAVTHIPQLVYSDTSETLAQRIEAALVQTNQMILRKGQSSKDFEGMGTTVVGLMFCGGHAIVPNVGDSRAYLIKKEMIFQLTRDHSLIQEKLNMEIYGREQAAADPSKNVITRTVGIDGPFEVDIFTYKVQKGDIFILCSDGLHGKVSDEDILHLSKLHLPRPCDSTQTQVESLSSSLIDQANDNGGGDNISAIVIVTN